MEHIEYCYLCGSVDRNEVLDTSACVDTYLDSMSIDYTGLERHLYKCSVCGLVYRSPKLDAIELERLYQGGSESPYRERIFKQTTAEQYLDRIISIPKDESENYMEIMWLKEHVLKINEPTKSEKHMIDIGCGFGSFLHHFTTNMKGWICVGMEPNIALAKAAQLKLGIPIHSEGWELNNNPHFQKRFDLISLITVLEHVPDPISYLEKIKLGLKANGLIFIVVPSPKDIGYLDPCHDTFMSPHLYLFDRNTTNQMCMKAGLKVTSFEYVKFFRGTTHCLAICEQAEENG